MKYAVNEEINRVDRSKETERGEAGPASVCAQSVCVYDRERERITLINVFIPPVC